MILENDIEYDVTSIDLLCLNLIGSPNVVSVDGVPAIHASFHSGFLKKCG